MRPARAFAPTEASRVDGHGDPLPHDAAYAEKRALVNGERKYLAGLLDRLDNEHPSLALAGVLGEVLRHLRRASDAVRTTIGEERS